MKKIIFFFTIIILCLSVTIHLGIILSTLKNVILIEYRDATTLNQVYTIENYLEKEKNIVCYTKYSKSVHNLSAHGRRLQNVSIYKVDGQYTDFKKITMLKGRFIWNEDLNRQENYIVLGKTAAVQLFSSLDCIGKEVYIDDNIYTVLGIYNNNESFWDMIFSNDPIIVYIPNIYVQQKENITYVFALKLKDKTSTILADSLKKDFESIVENNITVDNIDRGYRRIKQKCNIIYLMPLILILSVLIQFIITYTKHFLNEFKNTLQHKYVPDILKSYLWQLIAIVSIIVFLILIFRIIIHALQFDELIDPKIIPSRLVDINETMLNLREYIIYANTHHGIISTFHSAIANSEMIINCFCTITAFSVIYLLHNLLNKVKKMIGLKRTTDTNA